MNVSDDIFPKLESLQHIGFINTGQTLATFLRRLKSHMSDTTNFWLGITHGVKTFTRAFERAIGCFTHSARLTKIDIAIQFTHDENIET